MMIKNRQGNHFRISRSLTVKIFLLTMLVLVFVGLLTCGMIAAFLPVTYEKRLEKGLLESSEKLAEELEDYEDVYETQNALALFAAAQEAQAVLLDSTGETVFWEGAPEAETMAEEVTEDALAVSEEAVLGEGTYGGNSVAGEASAEEEACVTYEFPIATEDSYVGNVSFVSGTDQKFAMENYPVKIGEETYRLYVLGTMRAVNQTMEILKQIFPVTVGVIFAASLLCAAAASFYLTNPIMKLSRISRKMASLDFAEKCQVKRRDEIGVLAKSLNELSENLNLALAELRETNQKLRSFFAAASHELKTPVTILKGHLGGMCQHLEVYEKNQEEYLKRSYEVTNTLEGMIGEILAVSRVESGAWEPCMSRVDLAELVRVQVAELLELMEQKHMRFEADLPEHLFWQADGAMLIKVLRNLLVNAIRYSPAGVRIFLTLKETEGNACFWIENSGVHLPEEVFSHLFEPFYRVEASRNRESGGSGLGLYIVKIILELHHGVCGAKNCRDGVRVWFRIPR